MPFRHALASTCRAGLLAGAGSLLAALVITVVEDRFVPFGSVLRSDTVTLPAWLTGTMACAVAATFRALSGSARGVLQVAGRVVGASILGTLVGTVVLLPGVTLVEEAGRLPYFVTTGALLMVLIAATAPSPRVEVADGPGGLLPPAAPTLAADDGPTTYKLTGTGPPLTPEESELPDLVVEVRVLWGGELLFVRYLDPPGSFDVPGLSGRVVKTAGADGHDVLLDLAGGPAVLITAGRGGPVESTERVPLLVEDTVTVSRPGHGSGTAYRGAAEAAGAAIAIELTLVHAARVVGRGWSLRPELRPLASLGVAAVAVLGTLAFAASSVAVVDEDVVERERVIFIMRALQSANERESTQDEWDLGPDGNPHRRIPWWVRRAEPFYDGVVVYDGGQPPFCDAIRDNMFGAPADCAPYVVPALLLWSWQYNKARTPMQYALRDDLLADPRLERYVFDPLVAQPAGGASRATVTVRTPQVSGPVSPRAVEPIVGQNTARILACYLRLGGKDGDAIPRGTLKVSFVIDHDGHVSRGHYVGSNLPNWEVSACAVRSFEALSFPAPDSGFAEVTVPIDFDPGGG
jgi:hypothetical protein